MKKRIKALRETLGLSQEAFAKEIGLSRASVACYEGGVREPTEAVLLSISRTFGVDYLWLKEGEGQMFALDDEGALAMIDNILAGENAFAKNLFKTFATLSNRDWQDLERIIKKLKKGTDI